MEWGRTTECEAAAKTEREASIDFNVKLLPEREKKEKEGEREKRERGRERGEGRGMFSHSKRGV